MKEKCVPYVILLLYKLDTGHTEMHMSDNNRGVHMVPTRPPNQIPGRTYILFSALNHLSPGTNLTINNIENIGIKRLSKKTPTNPYQIRCIWFQKRCIFTIMPYNPFFGKVVIRALTSFRMNFIFLFTVLKLKMR